MKHRVLKSLVAGVLCVCLFVSSLPLGALAAVTQTKGNTAGENQAVLETLQALTGDEEQAAALESLQEYGLLDEDGNLRQTSTVTLDGKEMTLQQVREYLEDCGEEDLQKTVSIDGAEVTLENLQIMMEIEEEIARLRETYFSDEAPELTSEQETALNPLAAQRQERGITLQNEAAANGDFQFESGVDHTMRVSMSDVDPIDVKYITLKGPSSYTTVNFTTNKPAEQDIAFTVRTLAGSAKPSTNYEETLTQVRIAKGQSSASVQIPLRRYEFDWTDDLWTGDKVFFVQACDISGALFDNGEHSITKPIRLQFSEDNLEKYGGIPTEISFEALDTNDKYDGWQHEMGFSSRDMYFLRNSVTSTWMFPAYRSSGLGKLQFKLHLDIVQSILARGIH